jgi:hypothetical protein
MQKADCRMRNVESVATPGLPNVGLAIDAIPLGRRIGDRKIGQEPGKAAAGSFPCL